MNQPTVRRRSLTTAVALVSAALAATAVLGVVGDAFAQKAGPKAQKQPSGDSETSSSRGGQSIVVLVNDEPVTAWEVDQRAGFMAANAGPDPAQMKAKAEARWKAIMTDPKTNERFQQLLRDHRVSSKEQAQALQQQFVKKLQTDMIDQLRRESRSGSIAQFRNKAKEELIDEKLKVQEAKRLGVELTDEDANRMLQGLAERNKMTVEQFSQHVKGVGFDISTLRNRLRAEQVWREVIRRRYGGLISINQKEVDRIMSAAASEAGEDAFELQVQKITLPVQGNSSQAIAKRYAEAQALHGKFDGCKGMANLAKEIADARFEDAKYVKPGSLPEPTRTFLNMAKDGDMLPPATQANGIEIYAVCGRRALKGDDKQREQATQELQAKEFDIVAKRRLFDLRQEAHIETR